MQCGLSRFEKPDGCAPDSTLRTQGLEDLKLMALVLGPDG